MELSRDGMLDKMFQDMYLGNGQPPVTVRLESVEQTQETMSDKINKIERLLNKALWLLLGTLATGLIEIALKVTVK